MQPKRMILVSYAKGKQKSYVVAVGMSWEVGESWSVDERQTPDVRPAISLNIITPHSRPCL